MHTYKIAIFILAAGIMMTGCNSGFLSNEEVEDLKKELAESKKNQEELMNQYILQNEEITKILNDLAAISGRTADLRINVENGSARMTQAEQIAASIDKIKAHIGALEKSNSVLIGKNKDFQAMIEGFNQVIEEQERQILALKEEIAEKDKTIKSQKETIDNQEMTILQQRDKLKEQVAQQAKLLCDAGVLLEEIADNAPQVSWKKNKEKVGAMAQDIYRKALLYYQKASEAGYAPAKDHISAVNAKIQAE